MKNLILLILLLVIAAGCTKDDAGILTNENYIHCKIDGEPFLFYEKYDLNRNDTVGASYFSFGTQVISGKKDTLIVITATFNRRHLSLAFPSTDEPVDFIIYRNDPYDQKAFGTYQYVKNHLDVNEGIMVFQTRDFNHDDHFKTEVVGRISIVYANPKTGEFRGFFRFKAFGYIFPLNGRTIKSTNSEVQVTEGSFYYKTQNRMNRQ